MLTKEQLDDITKKQIEMQKRFRSVSDNGQYIKYLGKKFIVYKNVFWPFDDSKPLVKNYKIKSGDYVLNICTGSGVIAIFSAYKGAKKVVALDSNPIAIKTAKENIKLHGFSNSIDVRLSNMFEALHNNEQFDVITGNLPFRNMIANDEVEAASWDTNLNLHRKFFNNVHKYLKPNGIIYLSQANYGAVEDMKKLAGTSKFNIKLIGQKTLSKNDPRIFYAFKLTKKRLNDITEK